MTAGNADNHRSGAAMLASSTSADFDVRASVAGGTENGSDGTRTAASGVTGAIGIPAGRRAIPAIQGPVLVLGGAAAFLVANNGWYGNGWGDFGIAWNEVVGLLRVLATSIGVPWAARYADSHPRPYREEAKLANWVGASQMAGRGAEYMRRRRVFADHGPVFGDCVLAVRARPYRIVCRARAEPQGKWRRSHALPLMIEALGT
jgi:hypothetical protein